MIVSITHEHDLDGLGSQAILKRFYEIQEEKTPIRFIFAQYLNFVEKVKHVFNKNIPTELIITDLGFSEDFLLVFPILKNQSQKGCRISWYDHHLVDEDIKKKIKEFSYIYINNVEYCAAEIVKEQFLPNDPIACRIAELARDSDFKTKKFDLSLDLQLIIGYNRGEDKNNEKLKIVDLLSKGRFDDPWFDDQLKEIEDWYQNQVNLVVKNVKKVKLGKRIVLFSFGQIGGGKISDILKEKYPDSMAFIGIDSRFEEIIIHSTEINCRDFAKAFRGGGHKMRAGFRFSNVILESGEINPLFIKKVLSNLKKYTL
jgi:oligoribonuclease NrnB/cAMP/cGMP phosphodiesterase (DHH superfamily)